MNIIEILNWFKNQDNEFNYYNIIYYTLKNVLISNNPTNYKPYHNLKHTISVAEVSFNIAYQSNKFNIDDLFRLIIASFYHDYDHQGYKDDNLNVNHSINCMYNDLYELNGVDKIEIEFLIKQTIFPQPLHNHTELSKCLVIADLSCYYNQHPLDVLGLMSEYNMNLDSYLKMQNDFVSTYGEVLEKVEISPYTQDDFLNVLKNKKL